MIDGGNGITGVYVYGSLAPGNYELIIAGSYEENALMLAEANIRFGNIDRPGLCGRCKGLSRGRNSCSFRYRIKLSRGIAGAGAGKKGSACFQRAVFL